MLKYRKGDIVKLDPKVHGQHTSDDYGLFIVVKSEMIDTPWDQAKATIEKIYVFNKKKGWIDGRGSLLDKDVIIVSRARKITVNTRRLYE